MAWYNRFRRKAVVDKEGGTTPRAYKFFHPGQAFLLGFLLFGAFIIFLLVGICMPIIKAIYLFEIQAVPADGQPETSIGTQIRFGVWGLCITSALDAPTLFSNDGECFGPALGYTIPQTVLDLTGQASLVSVVLKVLTVLLILHPISAALSLLTMLPVFLTCCLFRTAPWVVSLILSIITALVSSVVFAADLALVVIARQKVKSVTLGTFEVHFGNGVWMVLTATVVTWICVVILSMWVCCGFKRRYRDIKY
ncbi:uncharacterized protein STEHIDRAFT_86784 [Stereum hirsutum FP-91666 SS1]|uniref:uncharacterized protein n=1 Tax=Stereum hirsutum (strain FP-91666) TaxID=721885 RepID=UPI000444A599|nr:uncharacterized protein STEHIDRAFT_86784 [Stereum hirsutum FP-91666 SS1]EIM80577.1 hypothetical protein STEHIDRAFT_86784 [Stereum hirsutum FP-91666 SS1]